MRSSRRIRTFLAGLTVALVAAQLGAAQPVRDRRQFFDGLVRGLVDSRMQQPTQRTEVRPRQSDSALLSQAAPLLNGLAGDMEKLTTAVSGEVARTPQLRGLVADVVRSHADAVVLRDRARSFPNAERMRADVRDWDSSWRVLHGQLTQWSDTNSTLRGWVNRVQSDADRLLDLLEIRPQLNASEVLRVLGGLEAALDHLAEDIDLELANSTSRDRLLRDARLVGDQVNYIARNVNNGASAETSVQEYRRFRDGWYSLASRLRPLRNTYIDRSVRRIERMDREARELLWITDNFDQAQVLNLAFTLSQDVDQLFDALSLNEVLEQERSSRAFLTSAVELKQRCNQLIRSFDGETSRDELASVFGRIQTTWSNVESTIRATNNNRARHLVGDIGETIEVIGPLVGAASGSTLDQRRLVQVAASVENLADHLLLEVSGYHRDAQRSGRQPPRGLLEAATRLRDQSRTFHRVAASSADLNYLRQENQRLTQSWNATSTAMRSVPGRDRVNMANIGANLTPGLIELQTLLAL